MVRYRQILISNDAVSPDYSILRVDILEVKLVQILLRGPRGFRPATSKERTFFGQASSVIRYTWPYQRSQCLHISMSGPRMPNLVRRWSIETRSARGFEEIHGVIIANETIHVILGERPSLRNVKQDAPNTHVESMSRTLEGDAAIRKNGKEISEILPSTSKFGSHSILTFARLPNHVTKIDEERNHFEGITRTHVDVGPVESSKSCDIFCTCSSL